MTQEIKIGSTVKRTDFTDGSDITTHPGVLGTVEYISIPTDLNDSGFAWANVRFTLDGEMVMPRTVALADLEVVNLRKSTTCPACDGTDLHWYVAKRRGGLSGFPGANGPLNISEVQVIGYLACEECSETVRTIEVEEIEEMLNLTLS